MRDESISLHQIIFFLQNWCLSGNILPLPLNIIWLWYKTRYKAWACDKGL